MTDWDEALRRMPDMHGQTVVVTGANSGLGYQATRAFATKGADVVMACRSLDRGADARDRLAGEVPVDSLELLELDLGDLSSVRAFADAFADAHDDLHVLCNNAGVMAIPRTETADGFETQFGVNHLGHFALTGHLLDALRDTAGETRVVTQSSGVHERGDVDFDDLQHERSYDKWAAYGQSKLANLLFAYELGRRLDRTGVEDVVSVGCHPGYADTDLQRRGPEQSGSTLRLWGMWAMNALVAQSAEMGALPMLYAATSRTVDDGDYVGPGGLFNMRGFPTVQSSSDRSYDEALARRLWSVSAELTDVSYDLDAPTTAR